MLGREMRKTTETTADRGAGGSGGQVPHAAASGAPGGGPGAGRPEPGRKPETYRSPLALLIWWVWVAFASANLIDLAVQGRDRLSAVAAAVLLLVTGIAYVAALRPRVTASGEGITVRNVLRDRRIPWSAVTKVDLGDLLRIHCAWPEPAGNETRGRPSTSPPALAQQRNTVIQVWAIQSSRRARTLAELRRGSGRAGLAPRSAGGFARPPEPSGAGHREAERIARTLDERAGHVRAQRALDNGPGDPEPAHEAGRPTAARPEWRPGPVAVWHWPSVAALVLPALLLIIVVFA